ncbi:MAG TPA: glutathione S-transferase family protein [Steroidobacteraceae bacterium]|nr:glutathione S-transferase family protein [Steroidobacteraceae bacterium]
MSALTLVIGTRNYSSWSLRPWLLLRHLGLPFSERLFELDSAEFAAEVPKISPTGRVPALIHGELRIWESLAICEYASELAGGRGWPANAARRAEARAIATEMHAGFPALRSACPMNARATGRRVALTPPLMQDLRRIDAIWSCCRRDHGDRGPYLYGEFSIADAMYAPVVLRIRSYGLPLSGLAARYHERMQDDTHLREWIRAAERETTVLPHEEAGAGA